jgi:signal peptide peptidase SppA
MFLPHLASRLYGTPLLLARSKLDIILSVLGSRVGWSESAPDLAHSANSAHSSRLGPFSLVNLPQDLSSTTSGIAIISVTGSLVRRSIGVDAQSGLMSYAEIASAMDSAANDPSISGILLDIDSPGGEAGGVFELAQHIREIDAIKPVWALSCDSAYSAAYAIACAASRVLVTQTGGVGSIGVIAMHVDQSARDAQQGYRFTAVTAGECKNDLSPHEPMNKASTARLQAEVDRLYGLFVDHVAAMRGISAKAVRATQAASYFGPEAVDVGLADALCASDQVIAEFAAYLAGSRVPSLVRASATRVISTSAAAFAADDSDSAATKPMQPPSSPLLNVNSKEILMTQDSRPNTVPITPDAITPVPATAADLPTTDGKPDEDVAPGAVPAPASKPDQAVVSEATSSANASSTSSAMPIATPNELSGAIASATLAAHAQAQEIAELCQLAGQSTRIASFLAQGVTSNQVRQTLLQARAQSEEITSLIHPDAPSKAAAANAGVSAILMAAVRKLTAH